MVILIALLIIFILLSVHSGRGEFMYVTKTGKNDEFIRTIYVWKLFLKDAFSKLDLKEFAETTHKNATAAREKSIKKALEREGEEAAEKLTQTYEKSAKEKINYEMVFNNILATFIFNNIGLPDFKSKDGAYEILARGIGIGNLDKLAEFYKELLVLNPNISYSENPKNMAEKCKLFKFQNRITYKPTLSEQFRATYFNDFVNNIQPGNQWTLISNEKMKKLISDGLLIECFGSSFNARAPFFGSLNEVDEPFGRIGDAFEILEKIAANETISWRDKIVNNGRDDLYILINPPGSPFVMYKSLEMVLKVLQNRKGKIRIIFEVPKSKMNNKFKQLDPYTKKEVTADKAYDFNGNEKNLTGREWTEFHLEN